MTTRNRKPKAEAEAAPLLAQQADSVDKVAAQALAAPATQEPPPAAQMQMVDRLPPAPLRIQTASPLQLAQISEKAQVLEAILQAARDPLVPIEKVERLLKLKREEELRFAEIEYNMAMNRAQARIRPVVRNRKNDHTKSWYATLDAVDAEIRKIYTDEGFSISFGTEGTTVTAEGKDAYKCTALCTHNGGFSREYRADVPSDAAGSQGKANKNATQAFKSTMTYWRRTVTEMAFNVIEIGGDDDGNAASRGELISEEQLAELNKFIEFIDADPVKICERYKVDVLADLPVKKFAFVMQDLKAWHNNQQRRG